MNSHKCYNAPVERLRTPERIRKLEVDRVLHHCLKPVGIHRILDVGCGSGIFMKAFTEAGIKATGLDVNSAMIEASQYYVPDAGFLIAVMEMLPFSDCSFDLVFFAHVLHESDQPVMTLKEAGRVGRDCAILEWPYRDEEAGPPLNHRLKPDQIQSYASLAGFRNVTSKPLNYMQLWLLSGRKAG